MKLLRKIKAIEVKKCFAMTDYMRKFGIADKHDSRLPSRKKYLIALEKSKRAVDNLSERQLDNFIGKHNKKRLRSYNSSDWYIGEVLVKEIGVWKGAGGLPVSWTRGSLFETAKKVKMALDKNSIYVRKRSKRAIPAIIELGDIIKKEKYLSPIVFESGTGTNGRKGLPKQRGDLDDGNMRAISFAISGDKKFKAYVGVVSKK